MVKDVLEGLKLVADGIESVKTIAEAVKSGKDYVRTKHPEIQGDLRAMIGELGKSLLLIKRASAVLTNFRFAISSDVRGSELARFNDYFVQAKAEAQHLRDHIEDLRTHCSKIRKHAEKISGSTRSGFVAIFTMLGLNSPKREEQLGESLHQLANEDFALANSAEKMLDCLEWALSDVQNALGEGGSMYPEKVPFAAALLAQYGPEFERLEERAAEEVKEIREVAKELE